MMERVPVGWSIGVNYPAALGALERKSLLHTNVKAQHDLNSVNDCLSVCRYLAGVRSSSNVLVQENEKTLIHFVLSSQLQQLCHAWINSSYEPNKMDLATLDEGAQCQQQDSSLSWIHGIRRTHDRTHSGFFVLRREDFHQILLRMANVGG